MCGSLSVVSDSAIRVFAAGHWAFMHWPAAECSVLGFSENELMRQVTHRRLRQVPYRRWKYFTARRRLVRLERLRLKTSLIFLLYFVAFSLKLASRVKRVCEGVYVHTYFK